MNQYFYEDQVYTVDKKGTVKFGLVVENEVNLRNFPSDFPDFIFNLWLINLFSIFIDKTDLLSQSSCKLFLFS